MRLLGSLVGGLFVLAAVLAVVEPYRMERVTAFLDPFGDAGDTGFQAVQALTAIGSGGLFGVGLGESVQKIFYLPEAHTDMILAIIGEELGVVGMAGVATLYGMIGYAGLRAAKAAADPYSKLVATGFTCLILSQATLNFFAVLGMAPLTGVPLPFISYGSTNLIVLLAGHGPGAQRGGHRRPARAGRQAAPADRSTEGAMPTIVIAAGGTAGHVVPALAVAAALRDSGARVEFVGGERAEAELVPAAGFAFHPLRVEGIDRRNPLKAARAVCRAAGATLAARRLLKRLGADAVMGGGGYVAAPVGLAARSLGLPVVATEADSHLGITNRLLARFAPARVPGLPDRRPRGRALPRGRPPAAGGHRQRGPRRRPAAVRHRARSDVRAGVRRLAGGAADQPGHDRRVRQRRARRRAARQRAARPRRAGRPPGRARLAAALPPARLHRPVRRRAGRRRPGRGPLRRLGAGGGGGRAARRCWCPTRTPPPTTRR